MHLAALATCLDAAAATGQLAPAELGRLREALDDLRSLAYLQPLLEQVTIHVLKKLPVKCKAAMLQMASCSV